MSTNHEENCEKIRRSVSHEFVRMEDDFDKARDARDVVIDKIMTAVGSLKFVDETGGISEDAEVGVKVANLALKAIADKEKANALAIGLKLRNQEQEMASAAASHERIQIILKATAPGKIEEGFELESIDETLADMFEGQINTYELKNSSLDLQED